LRIAAILGAMTFSESPDMNTHSAWQAAKARTITSSRMPNENVLPYCAATAFARVIFSATSLGGSPQVR
jgi:hypothetical protein